MNADLFKGKWDAFEWYNVVQFPAPPIDPPLISGYLQTVGEL